MSHTQVVKDYFRTPENALAYYRQEVRGFSDIGKGHCPFHTDERESFSVYEGYKFKCFAGCGNGDVIAFHQRKYQLDFRAAISDLAERAGIKTDKTYSLEDIKRMQPEKGFSFQRYHTYKEGNPPYIKPIYKDEQGVKTSRYFTLMDNGQYAWGRKSKPVFYNHELLQKRPNEPVCIPEGEKDCDTLTSLGLLAVTAGSASDQITPSMENLLKGRDVLIFIDDDTPGKKRGKRDAATLHGIAKSLKVIELPDLPEKKGADITDWIQNGGTTERLLELIKTAPGEKAKDTHSRISIISLHDFLALDLPPRQTLLSPWLPSQGLCMVYGYRGAGKTYILLGIAVALSSGGAFLKWQANEPKRVLYIDGEMPAVTMQERIANVIRGVDKEPLTDHLHFITPDLQEHGIPDLATPEGQRIIEPYAEQANVIILDNISTLCRSGVENKGEDWSPVQAWILNLRRKGVSVIFVHHEGKNGFQRGTSKREDVLDTVIKLKRPGDYNPSEGLRVEVHFEKARGIFGDVVKPFETKLITDHTGSRWEVKDLEQSLTERVADLLKEGIPQHEIPDLLNVSKGTVSKHKRKAMDMGLLT